MRKILTLALLCLSCTSEQEVLKTWPPLTFPTFAPEIVEEESQVSFVLSSFETKYEYKGSFKSRAANIELAARLLNDFVLKPNEEFSFNELVGPRTEDTGFKEAPIYFDGVKTQGMGGGVCQVSSTLYATAMLGHLLVTQRTAHTRPSSYIPRGLDATVSYPDLDLKIVNTYDVELTIIATAESGILRIYLLGRKRDFEATYRFYGHKILPYEKRTITRSYQRRDPFLHQKGRDGMPGRTVWYYKYPDRTEKVVVSSKYKPVDEVWYAGPNTEEDDDDTGRRNESTHSGS